MKTILLPLFLLFSYPAPCVSEEDIPSATREIRPEFDESWDVCTIPEGLH